jgi:hypothetical protein
VKFNWFRRWWGRKNPYPNIGMAGDGDEMDLLQGLEHDFAITFDDVSVGQMVTVGDIQTAILAKTSGLSSDEVWVKLTWILQNYSAVKAPDIRPEMMLFDRIYE